MKHTTIFVIALLSLSLAVPTALAASTTFEGSILVGNPATGVVGGVTEHAAPCDTDSTLNGVDGQWFDIAGFEGANFTLTMDSTLDADVWFYTAECSFISDSSGAQNFVGTAESGTVPANAAFAVVDGFAGTGSFALTLTTPS